MEKHRCIKSEIQLQLLVTDKKESKVKEVPVVTKHKYSKC